MKKEQTTPPDDFGQPTGPNPTFMQIRMEMMGALQFSDDPAVQSIQSDLWRDTISLSITGLLWRAKNLMGEDQLWAIRQLPDIIGERAAQTLDEILANPASAEEARQEVHKAKKRIAELQARQQEHTRPADAPVRRVIDDYYSCFISYSSKDMEFAQRLYRDLQDRGVRCWYAPENMKTGVRIRSALRLAIRKRDKFLLILSKESIGSRWVEDEVETAFEEEEKRGEVVLFPIRLDDTVLETEEAWAAAIRRTRHIGDFSAWREPFHYRKALNGLVGHLRTEKPPSDDGV